MKSLAELIPRMRTLKRMGASFNDLSDIYDLPVEEVKELLNEGKYTPAENWICLACKDGFYQPFHVRCPNCGKWYSDTLKIKREREAKRSLLKTSANNVIAE